MVVIAYAGGVFSVLSTQVRVFGLGLAAVGAIIWLAMRWRALRDPPLWWAGLIFGGLWAVSAVLALDPRRAWLVGWIILLYGLVYWAASDLASDPSRARDMVSAALLAGAILAGLALISPTGWLIGWAGLRLDGVNVAFVPPRPDGATGNPNSFASLLLMLMPGGWARLAAARTRSRRAIWAGWSALIGLVLLVTGSRGAWLAGAVGLGVFGWLIVRPRLVELSPAWRWGILIGLGLAGLIAVPLVISGLAHPTHGTLAKRADLWATALAMFARRPLVGLGPRSFATEFPTHVSVPPEQAHFHAHNLILQVMGETGLLGLAGAVTLGVAMIRRGRAAWRASDPAARPDVAAAWAGGLALLVHHMLDFTLWLPAVSLAGIWIGAGLIGAARLPAPSTRTHLARVGAGVGVALLIGSGVWAMRGEWAAWRGWVAALEGDWEAAVDHYAEAARLDPALLIYRLDRAYALGEIGLEGDPDALGEAIEEYRAILGQEPNFAPNWANLGLLLAASGDEDGARMAARRALELAPDELSLKALAECVEASTCDAERVAEMTLALREPLRLPDFSSGCAAALGGGPVSSSQQAIESALTCAVDGKADLAARLLDAADLLATNAYQPNALDALAESLGDLPGDPLAARRAWEAYNRATAPDPLDGLYSTSIGYSRFVFRRPGVPGALIGQE
jgi:hypothetical protein